MPALPNPAPSLLQLRIDTVERRHCDSVHLQEREEGIDRLQVDQILCMPNGYYRSVQSWLVPILLNDPAHHGCELVYCHTAEIDLAWGSKTPKDRDAPPASPL